MKTGDHTVLTLTPRNAPCSTASTARHLRIVTGLARVFGAEQLTPVTAAHVDGCLGPVKSCTTKGLTSFEKTHDQLHRTERSHETVSTEADPLDLPSFAGGLNLRQHVAHALRAALVAGKLRPRVVYSAPTLAEQFGVSPTPVREALLDLAKEGLVEVVRNKGFRVTELSERDLDEITELRALIEVPTVAQLSQSITLDALASLRPLADAIVSAAEKPDLIAYIEADRRFHLELLAFAGNNHLVEVVGDLRKRSRLYGLAQLAETDQLTASSYEHVDLLDILAGGNPRQAASLMHRHLGHVRGSWAGQPE